MSTSAARHGWLPVSVLMVACAAPLGAARVTLEAPGRPGPRAVVEWFDDAGSETRRSEVHVEGAAIEVPGPRPGEGTFRVLSGEWISRQTSVRGSLSSVKLEPSTRLVLGERPVVVLLAATASSLDTAMSPAVPVEVFDGRAFVKTDAGFEIQVPRGPSVVCVSSGAKLSVFPDGAAGAVRSLSLTSPDLAEVALVVRTTESRDPILAGVLIEAPRTPTIEEYLVAAAVGRRMMAPGAPSQTGGAWRLGPVPAGARLVVVAPERRRSSIRVAGGANGGEGGAIEVVLPRYQDVRFGVDMPGLPFTAELQCCSGNAKAPCEKVRDGAPGSDGTVSFRNVAPGPLRLLVRSGQQLVEAVDAVASDDAAAPQTLEITVALRRFHVGGTLVLKGAATGVQGRLLWQRPAAAGAFRETIVETDTVGRFQFEVIGAPGGLLRLQGQRAVDGLGSRPVILSLGSGEELDVTIPIEPARALQVKLVDRKSGDAIPGCSVLGKTVETSDPRSSSIRSDREGVARFQGWPAVRTSLIATCRTHKQPKPLVVETAEILDAGEVRMELEEATGLRFLVRNPNGSPAAGVKLRVPDPALSSLPPFERMDKLIPVGTTDASGLYEIAPSLQGAPFWFLSPGGALALRRATDPACEEAPCTIEVGLQVPGAFSGLKLRRQSGAPVSALPLLFSIGDQLVSPKLLSEAAEISGIHVSTLVPTRVGEPTLVPALLEAGEYGVYAYGRDSTGTMALKKLGAVAVPSAAVQEIVIDDIVKR